MTTDRELLEKAAKAAGIELLRCRLDDPMWRDMLLTEATYSNGRKGWNPLTDDGDALRLAVQLRIRVWYRYEDGDQVNCICHGRNSPVYEDCKNDAGAATRRAIVRAAAAVGDQS